MKTLKTSWCVLGLAVLGAACDGPPQEHLPSGLGALDGSTPDSDAAVLGNPDDAGTSTQDGALPSIGLGATVPKSGPSYAVVSSDYTTSTAISILDPQGNLVPRGDNYINTGSVKPNLTTALSPDLELPKHSGETGVMVLIDRFNYDVITRIRLSDGAILGQVKTHTPPTQASTSSYSSNPQDYIYIDEQTAWVTRAEPNLDPNPNPADLGSDMIRIIPATMTRANERIDLSVLATTVSVTTGNTTTQVAIHPRPARMLRLGNTVVVGAGRISSDFSVYADGAVGIVDLTTKTATAFAIDGMKDCEGVDSIPNDADSVLISCAGAYGDNKNGAGFVILGLSNGVATIEHAWHAKDNAAALPYTSRAIALGGTIVAGVAEGYMNAGADVLAIVDVATGATTAVKSETPGTGRWGTPSYDADSKLLLVPDASSDGNKKPTSGVRRFQRNADDSFTELSVVQVAVSSTLPVRHVFPL